MAALSLRHSQAGDDRRLLMVHTEQERERVLVGHLAGQAVRLTDFSFNFFSAAPTCLHRWDPFVITIFFN